jgi:hypothetical protein
LLKDGGDYYMPTSISIQANERYTDFQGFRLTRDITSITSDDDGRRDVNDPVGGTTGTQTGLEAVAFTTTPGGAVDSVNGQTGTVVLDGDDIAYDASFTVNDLIDANTSNIDNLKTYVVAATDKIELREDANNKVTVDGATGTENIALTVDGTDVFRVNGSEAIASVDTEAPTLEANTFAGGLILKDSTGTRWRVQVQTDGTLRTTSL